MLVLSWETVPPQTFTSAKTATIHELYIHHVMESCYHQDSSNLWASILRCHQARSPGNTFFRRHIGWNLLRECFILTAFLLTLILKPHILPVLAATTSYYNTPQSTPICLHLPTSQIALNEPQMVTGQQLWAMSMSALCSFFYLFFYFVFSAW